MNRDYGSESHLELTGEVILTKDPDNDESEHDQESKEEILSKPVGVRTRTLSDSVTYSKPEYSNSSINKANLKIDSNYSEAIEEV